MIEFRWDYNRGQDMNSHEIIRNLANRLEGLSEVKGIPESVINLHNQEARTLRMVIDELSNPGEFYLLFGNMEMLTSYAPYRLAISSDSKFSGLLTSSSSFNSLLIDLYGYGLSEPVLNLLLNRRQMSIPRLNLPWMKIKEFCICRPNEVEINGDFFFFLLRFSISDLGRSVSWRVLSEVRKMVWEAFPTFVDFFNSINTKS